MRRRARSKAIASSSNASAAPSTRPTPSCRKREKSLAEREEVFKKRLNERLDDRLRQARRDVDAVIEQLKEKSDALAEKASLRAAINTGETGVGARRSARARSIASSRICGTRSESEDSASTQAVEAAQRRR